MQEGSLEGWLIDSHREQVHICRTDVNIQIVKSFEEKLSGEGVLKGVELEHKESY